MNDNIIYELLHRIKNPWCWSFTLYFIIVIIIFGGIGVWLPIWKEGQIKVASLAINMITYSCALIVPAVVSIMLSMRNYKNKVSLVLFVSLVLLVVAITVGCSVFAESLLAAIVCLVLSLLFWVIANYDNVELNDGKYNESIKAKSQQLSSNW